MANSFLKAFLALNFPVLYNVLFSMVLSQDCERSITRKSRSLFYIVLIFLDSKNTQLLLLFTVENEYSLVPTSPIFEGSHNIL